MKKGKVDKKKYNCNLDTTNNFICSHNDLPWTLRRNYGNKFSKVNLFDELEYHTDIPRLRKGKVGGQVSLHLNLSSNTLAHENEVKKIRTTVQTGIGTFHSTD